MECELTDDELFRWAFVAILVAFLPFALYHRIRSNLTGEKLDRWQEGAFILFGLRLSGLPWFIGGIVWMVDNGRRGESIPKLFAWNTKEDRLHRIIYLPPPTTLKTSFLDDLAIRPHDGACIEQRNASAARLHPIRAFE